MMHVAFYCIQFSEDSLSDDPLDQSGSSHLSFSRNAPELGRQELCAEQRLKCMNEDVFMHLLFRRLLTEISLFHLDSVNAFELPDRFQVQAFVPNLLRFLFSHRVNGINDLVALVLFPLIKQLRFRDFPGLCQNRSEIPPPELSISECTMHRFHVEIGILNVNIFRFTISFHIKIIWFFNGFRVQPFGLCY